MKQNNFLYLLISSARQIRTMVKMKTTDIPFTFEQLRAISYIDKFEGLSQKKLSDLLEIKPIAATKTIRVLEKNKLVIRKEDSCDKRAYCLYLSNEGRKISQKIQLRSKDVFTLMIKGLTEKEIKLFNEISEKMNQNLKSQLDFKEL